MEALRDFGLAVCECGHIREHHVDCGLPTGLSMCHGNLNDDEPKCFCPIFKETSEPVKGHDCMALKCKTTGHK